MTSSSINCKYPHPDENDEGPHRLFKEEFQRTHISMA